MKGIPFYPGLLPQSREIVPNGIFAGSIFRPGLFLVCWLLAATSDEANPARPNQAQLVHFTPPFSLQ